MNYIYTVKRRLSVKEEDMQAAVLTQVIPEMSITTTVRPEKSDVLLTINIHSGTMLLKLEQVLQPLSFEMPLKSPGHQQELMLNIQCNYQTLH